VRAELPNSAGADLLYANWLFFAGTRRTDVKARTISSSSISRDRSSARAQCRRWTAVRISHAGRAGQRLVLEPRGRSGWSCARHHSRRGLNRRSKIQQQDLETRPQNYMRASEYIITTKPPIRTGSAFRARPGPKFAIWPKLRHGGDTHVVQSSTDPTGTGTEYCNLSRLSFFNFHGNGPERLEKWT